MTVPAPAEPDGAREPLVEERDFLLRSLRDLDAERAAGDLDEADYASLREAYTRRAAEVVRRLERIDRGEPVGDPGEERAGEAAPAATAGEDGAGEEATATAEDDRAGEPASAATAGEDRAAGAGRRRVRLRRTLIGLGVALCVGGAGWAAAAASGARLPGQTITGDKIGPEKIAAELLAASQASDNGHPVQALKDYQTVLHTQPDNPTALTGSAAILVSSNQNKLVGEGAVMLAKAEHVDPSYAPAYLYLGRALTLLGDDTSAEKQLHTFLADQPKGATAKEARKLLAYAGKQAAKAKAASGGSSGGSAGG